MDWYWLLFLICPLMMLPMMFGMGGKHKHGSKTDQTQANHQIHHELSELKAQNEQMKQEIQSLKESH